MWPRASPLRDPVSCLHDWDPVFGLLELWFLSLKGAKTMTWKEAWGEWTEDRKQTGQEPG